MSVRYQIVEKFASESGYTVSAIETNITRGIWIEGRQWRKAPDGRNLIEKRQEPSNPARRASD